MNSPPDQRTISMGFSRGEAFDIMEDLPLGHSVSEATRDFYRRLRQELRSQPQGEHVAQAPDVTGDDVIYAPPVIVRPAPARRPRRGLIIRKVDVTGISGLGVIAEFCVFSDNFTLIRWLGGPPQNQPKHEVYDNPGIDPFIQISGHNGNTDIVWLDEEEPGTEVPLDQ